MQKIIIGFERSAIQKKGAQFTKKRAQFTKRNTIFLKEVRHKQQTPDYENKGSLQQM